MDKKSQEANKKREPFINKINFAFTHHKLTEKQRDKAFKQLDKKIPYVKDGFNDGGYEWCVLNWGTKWGICHPTMLEHDTRELKYGFECAWSPSLPIIEKMSELFPNLKFKLKYWEMGMGYKGIMICNHGKVISHRDSEYHGHRGG